MQAQQQTTTPTLGFDPIPGRIRAVPPLITSEGGAADTAAKTRAQLEELGRSLARTHHAAAEAWLAVAGYAEARAHLSAAITFAPDEIAYHNQLGHVAYLAGDDGAAAQSFEHVLSVQPDHVDALCNLGMVLFGHRDPLGAEECFRRASLVEGGDAEIWNNRGVCLHQLGRMEEARACFERALAIEPANEDARVNLGTIR